MQLAVYGDRVILLSFCIGLKHCLVKCQGTSSKVECLELDSSPAAPSEPGGPGRAVMACAYEHEREALIKHSHGHALDAMAILCTHLDKSDGGQLQG